MVLDDLPFTGQVTTYSVREDNPSKPDYDSESGSTSTAWSTGQKTSDGRISTAPGTDLDMTTILELAQKKGMLVGNITTSELTDATPAGPMSHVRLRGCQGPLDMNPCPQDRKSVGGPGSIAEQGIDHGIDVLTGGGKSALRPGRSPRAEPNAGKTHGAGRPGEGVFALHEPRRPSRRDAGQEGARSLQRREHERALERAVAARPPSGPQRCGENAAPANEPTLAEMTRKAIELLDRRPPDSRAWVLPPGRERVDRQARSRRLSRASRSARRCSSTRP